jgi:molybdate transport system regulatory protein
MRMSYRKAWLLLKALEETFGGPLVGTSTGGKAGGGARLTPLGRLVVSRYRSLEKLAGQAARPDVVALTRRAQIASPKSATKRAPSVKALK